MALTLAPKSPGGLSDSPNFFQKQRAAIDKLRADNLKLKQELLLENRFSVQPSTAAAAALIKDLKDEGDSLSEQIQAEHLQVAQLTEQAKELKSVVENQKRDMGGIYAAQHEQIQAKKAMFQLEGRKQQANIRHNEALTKTRALKEKINDLRREKLAFEDMLRKLDRVLSTQRADLASAIRSIHASNAARDKAMHASAQITAQMDREQVSSESEWATLTQFIEGDRRQQDAARTKEIEAREQRTQALLNNEASVVKQATAAARSQAAQDASVQRVKELQAAFAKIGDTTGTGNIETLLAKLLAVKDSNFSLLSYVADLNVEVDKTEAQIAALTEELARYKGSGASAADARRHTLEDLEGKLQEAVAKASAAENRAQTASEALSSVRKQVGALFVEAGCDTAAVKGLLGGSGVQDSNLVQYLGIIEQRAHELLQEYVMAVSADEKTVSTRMNALLTSGSLTSEPSLGAVSGTSSSGSGASIGALPVFVIDAPSSVGAGDSPLGDLGDGGDDTRDNQPVDRKILEARIERALARHGDAAIHQKDAVGQAAAGTAAKPGAPQAGSPLRSSLGRSMTMKGKA